MIFHKNFKVFLPLIFFEKDLDMMFNDVLNGKKDFLDSKKGEGRKLTTNSTHIWRRRQDSNPGHIGGRRVLSPLRHPCSQT